MQTPPRVTTIWLHALHMQCCTVHASQADTSCFCSGQLHSVASCSCYGQHRGCSILLAFQPTRACRTCTVHHKNSSATPAGLVHDTGALLQPAAQLLIITLQCIHANSMHAIPRTKPRKGACNCTAATAVCVWGSPCTVSPASLHYIFKLAQFNDYDNIKGRHPHCQPEDSDRAACCWSNHHQLFAGTCSHTRTHNTKHCTIQIGVHTLCMQSLLSKQLASGTAGACWTDACLSTKHCTYINTECTCS